MPALPRPLLRLWRRPASAAALKAGASVSEHRLANGLRSRLLRDDTRDTGCGLKAFPRELYLSLPYFDHQHRFLPALVRREGYAIRLVDVAHRPRTAGRTKYTNLGRAMVGLLDLVGVWWLLRRRKLAIVVLPATSWPRLRPVAAKIAEFVATAAPGTISEFPLE